MGKKCGKNALQKSLSEIFALAFQRNYSYEIDLFSKQ
jgi:hypothetical protein